MEPSRLTNVRVAQARRDEAQVLAEESLRAERVIGWVRVALALGMGLAGALSRLFSDDPSDPRDLVRAAAATTYATFAVVLALKLRKMKPSPRRQLFGPLASMATDYTFAGFMILRRIQVDDALELSMLSGIGCVFILFCIFRFSLLHTLVSTGLAFSVFALSVTAAVLSEVSVQPIGVMFSAVALAMTGGLVGFANVSVRRMFVDLRRRDNLARFLPSQVAERVLRSGGRPLEPVQREVTVLFTDVRDFTSLSERMAPAEVLELLNGLLGELSQIVKGRDGMVNKFLGDGMLAVWGVPERDERHAERAVRAARDMLVRVAELSREREARGEPALRIGVGIHTGPVAAGMIGGADQHEYTVIGDAVNLASRIEGLTKTYGCGLLVSARTAELLGGRFVLREVADAPVKGRVQSVKVLAVEGEAPAAAEDGDAAQVPPARAFTG